jgi:hypothetical protein
MSKFRGVIDMDRQPVSSTSLRSVGYDLKNHTLEIEFQSGEVYDYLDVPREVYVELMHADSHGLYFIQNIRDQYRYEHC